LAFVREVQEIAEKIEGEISLKDLVEIDEIYITAEGKESSRIDLEEEV